MFTTINLHFTTFCWGYSLCDNSPNAIFLPEGRNNQIDIFNDFEIVTCTEASMTFDI